MRELDPHGSETEEGSSRTLVFYSLFPRNKLYSSVDPHFQNLSSIFKIVIKIQFNDCPGFFSNTADTGVEFTQYIYIYTVTILKQIVASILPLLLT